MPLKTFSALSSTTSFFLPLGILNSPQNLSKLKGSLQFELFLKFPHQPYHLAQDAKFSCRDGDRSIFFVLRFESDDAVFSIETFQGRFTFDQGTDDLAVLCRPLLLHNHAVTVQDSGADHAVSFDLQGKKFS